MTDRDLLVSIAEGLGQVRGRIDGVAADVSLIREGYQQQGLVLGQLQKTCAARGAGCAARLARQSEEIARLGGSVEEVEEVSEVLHVADIRRKAIWWTVVKVAGALVAMIGIATGAIGAIQSCHTAKEVKRDLKKATTVRVKLVDQPWCATGLAELHGLLERRLPHGEWMRLATDDVPWPRWR